MTMLQVSIAWNQTSLSMKINFNPFNPWIINALNSNEDCPRLTNKLSRSNEPDIFDIIKDQKYSLNQFIYFATTNWGKHQQWYVTQCCFASKKNSKQAFVNIPWTKLTLLNTSLDFFHDICKILEKMNPFLKSKRTIDYIQTFFPNTLTSTLICFFDWPKFLYSQYLYNFPFKRHTPFTHIYL